MKTKTFADYFEIIKFATPETNVRLKNILSVPETGEIIIKKCMNWEDIMHLDIADTILTRNDIFVQWYVPYKPFARQDRTTALNHGNESAHIQDILSTQKDRMIFLDVHSDRYSVGKSLHQFSPIKYYNPIGKSSYGSFGEWYANFHLIVPDKGAQKKIPHNFCGSMTCCSKKRDSNTGKLWGFEVPPIKASRKEALVLIDDICDGGGTFIGIAEELQQYRNKHRLILYVTHGLFTKGVDTLFQYFDEIITTNSIFNGICPNENFKVLDVLSEDFIEYALKQVNQ